MINSFEEMLKGGHPNSLGRTLEVVGEVEKDSSKLKDLLDCYSSQDEVVRLRVSNAVKRTSREHKEWLVPYLDLLLNEISQIDQASTQWTLAELYATLKVYMSKDQYEKAKEILKRNLDNSKDWIVINWTLQTLADWALAQPDLGIWLKPRLEKFSKDKHRSIRSRSEKLKSMLGIN